MDIFKKTFYAGMGLAFITKEKIEEIAEDLIEKGKLTEKEAKEFIDKWVKKSKEAKTKVDGQIHKTVDSALKSMHLVTKEEYDRLEKRLKELEKTLKEKAKKV